MKKISSIFGILSTVFLSAQTSLTNTENYIYTKNCLNTNCTKASESVQYFDSFGKPYQSIGIKSTPNGKDLVQHIPYDRYGRSVDNWNPVPMNTQGGAVHDSILVKSTAITMYNDNRPFSHSIIESSPLNRVLSQILPGQEWQTHPVTMGYDTNVANEVKKYAVSTTWVDGRTESVLSLSGNYPANILLKNSVTDEDGNISIEFKNKQGQLILVKKGFGSTDVTDTYYVYNEFGHLVYVLPPLAANISVDSAVLESLCYQYRYDGLNRLVEKKIPGKGWEYMVYDKADRLILSQDSNLKSQGKWLITKYDLLGRSCYTGIITGGDRAQMQNQITNTVVSETRDVAGFTRNGMQVYYTNINFPQIETILSINYYDTYPTYSFNPTTPSTIYGSLILTDNMTADLNTKGVHLMSLVKNTEDDNWTKSYSWYDGKGRLTGTHSINHLGGFTKTESDIDFSGLVIQNKTYHKRLDTDTENVITQSYEYDPQGRILVKKHKINNNAEEILVQNEYNQLSQLIKKKMGGINSAQPLQTIDYTYNIRGWTTQINDPQNLGSDLFGYYLKYQNPQYTNIAPGKFNGNITEIDWKSLADNILKRYTYKYDGLSRLKDAIYTEPNASLPFNNNYNENVTYDLNGNIKTLKRNAFPVFGTTSTQVDDLEYQYTGNRLDKVIENSLNDTGYEGGNNPIAYDLSGNMIDMKDKGIQSILYNYLNLPTVMSISQIGPLGTTSNFSLEYLYSADGTKLRKSYISGGGKGSAKSMNSTDYLDGFQYSYREISSGCAWCRTDAAYEQQAYKNISTLGSKEWKLDLIPTSEGFYSFAENRYIYQYQDHLGNARISFAQNSAGVLEITDSNSYYPFGLNHIGGNDSGNLGSYFSYKFNGKELQETGMYDYGARFYMPDLGRWSTTDPLSEQMRSHSPYNYAFNNPIGFIDPDGKKPMIYNSGGVMRWEFDPLTTLTGSAWFDGPDFASSSSFAGSSILSQAFTGGGGEGSDDTTGTPTGTTYYGEAAYNELEKLLSTEVETKGSENCCFGLLRFMPLFENSSIKPTTAVETLAKSNEHHIIPRQFKNTEIVKEAKDQGFKFEGKENKTTLEQFSKTTGQGRHGNHPKYNQQISELLKEIPKSDALNGVRNLKERVSDIINSNPDTKINDLKLKNATPVINDNTIIKIQRPAAISPRLRQNDWCKNNPNCI